jgi:rubredoxin
MHSDPVGYRSDRTTPIDGLCPKCGRASKRVATLLSHVENREYEVFRCLACGFVQWTAPGLERRRLVRA